MANETSPIKVYRDVKLNWVSLKRYNMNSIDTHMIDATIATFIITKNTITTVKKVLSFIYLNFNFLSIELSPKSRPRPSRKPLCTPCKRQPRLPARNLHRLPSLDKSCTRPVNERCLSLNPRAKGSKGDPLNRKGRYMNSRDFRFDVLYTFIHIGTVTITPTTVVNHCQGAVVNAP